MSAGRRLATPVGDGRLVIGLPEAERGPVRGVLLLGHGAGGDVDAPDLVAVRDAALAGGVAVALFTQPYRVAGRRAPAPARQLDAAWAAAVASVGRRRALRGLPLVVGGRSSGARVACRTAAAAGAVAVVALAFPVHPPGRPEVSRLDELDAVPVPVLVVQGVRDAFGRPPAAPAREVVVVAGDHSLRRDTAAVADAVVRFLDRLLPAA
nr:alpha/beta family hydrolase [Luteimicrobium subarcticum]